MKPLARRGRSGASNVGVKEHAFGSVDEPYLLIRSRRMNYDVGHCERRLGAEWLSRACSVVRDFDGTLARSRWIQSYVRPFCSFASFLDEHARVIGAGFWQWRDVAEDWEACLNAYRLLLETQQERQVDDALSEADYIVRVLSSRGLLLVGSALLERRSSKHLVLVPAQTTKIPAPLPLPRHVYLVGRAHFDCRPFAYLGDEFVRRYGTVVHEHASGRGKAKFMLAAAGRSFLEFLDARTSDSGLQRFYDALASGQLEQLSSEDWEVLLLGWREEVKERLTPAGKLRTPHTINNDLGRMRGIWELLVGEGIVPRVELPGVSAGRRRHRTSRPGLAQLNTKAKLKVPEAFEEFIGGLEEAERTPAMRFVEALCADIGAQAAGALTTEGLVNAIVDLNDRRLAAIRSCAEKTWLHWRGRWELGQRLIAECRFTPSEIGALLDPAKATAGERMRTATTLFSEPSRQDALANLLVYSLHASQGRTIAPTGAINTFCKHHEGRVTVQAFVHPHPKATLALCLILMVDSGANVEVVRGMPFHCWGTGEEKGQREVRFDEKARAGNKRITDFLYVKPLKGQQLSSVEALEQYIEMSHRMRLLAKPDEAARMLLVFTKTGEPVRLASWHLGTLLKSFIDEHEELQAFRFAASSIRVSVLLSEHFHNPRGLEAAQSRGDHDNPTTTRDSYTGSYPNQMVYNQLMREFLDRFQAIVVVTIDGAAAKLGLKQEEFDFLVSDAARTGLGFACLNSKLGIQPGTRAGRPCTELQNCADCQVRWVVATVDNIADMILTNETLNRQMKELSEQDLDLFETRWLKTLALTEVSLRKFAQDGETAALLAQAKSIADSRRPEYVPFPLV